MGREDRNETRGGVGQAVQLLPRAIRKSTYWLESLAGGPEAHSSKGSYEEILEMEECIISQYAHVGGNVKAKESLASGLSRAGVLQAPGPRPQTQTRHLPRNGHGASYHAMSSARQTLRFRLSAAEYLEGIQRGERYMCHCCHSV